MMRTIFLAALALGSCEAASEVDNDRSFNARTRALDGDTVAVDFRLLGVDAFERRQPCERRGACWQCGKAAQDYAATLLRSKTAQIRLSPSTTYGRPVATVTVDGADLGERLIRAGLALPKAQYLRGDPRRAARYATAFSQAKAAKAGALSGGWIEPSRWRRGERLQCERRPIER
ncbi:thermonuclease family protein [Sphingomonas gei]|uniref:Thermonuclease family protein n=1 Tax=Sphingomonas gei TaxID=1395960 RepID=A0A4S1WZM5_9SPHN|nr:thermonuclease family protein [Sphingomonas gei]TGX49064.1 thermonuclease family protein [Sphingomonas gei]